MGGAITESVKEAAATIHSNAVQGWALGKGRPDRAGLNWQSKCKFFLAACSKHLENFKKFCPIKKFDSKFFWSNRKFFANKFMAKFVIGPKKITTKFFDQTKIFVIF